MMLMEHSRISTRRPTTIEDRTWREQARRLGRFALLPVLMLLAAGFALAAERDSKGTDFWLAFPTNFSGTPTLNLYISAETSTSGTVTVSGIEFTRAFTVTPGVVTTVAIPAAAQLDIADGTQNKAIHVTAAAEVSVYGYNHISATTDSYLGLPKDALGTDYIVLGYKNGLSGSQLAVVATADGTGVTITPSRDTGSHPAGVPFTITLNQGQAYQLRSTFADGDVTGTLVTATSPVSVFGGHLCANIPPDSSACDHLIEQIPPTSAWGKNFVAMPLAGRRGDTYRVLASVDQTTVTINGESSILNKGGFVERIITTPAQIQATQPVLVAQFANGTSFDESLGDPFMMLIPATDQFLTQYTVMSGSADFASNYINVVVPTSAVGSVLLDGAPIPEESFTPIGTSGFSGTHRTAAVGSHNLSAPVAFAAWVYGFGAADSYGYPAGMLSMAIGSITLSPKTGSGPVGQQYCVNATVRDYNNQPIQGASVAFSVTGTNPRTASVETAANGIATFCYTAQTPGDDTITARAGNFSDTATKHWAYIIVVSPTTITLPVDRTQQFTASVTPATESPLIWLVNGIAGGNLATIGSISSTGLYTAPHTPPVEPVSVTARLPNLDSSNAATVTVIIVTVTVTPSPVEVPTSRTRQFTATVNGATNPSVTWSLVGPPDQNIGSISATGLYTAPPSVPAGPVNVVARSVQYPTETGAAEARIVEVQISVSPTTAEVPHGLTRAFTATVTGPTDKTVKWFVNGIEGGNGTVGTISIQGVYTAPEVVPTPADVTITATSVVDDSKSAAARVTVIHVSVSISPKPAEVPTGRSLQFTATVTGPTDKSVTWTVNDIEGGNATIGTITAGGLYTAPAAVPEAGVVVAARSKVDPRVPATAPVTVVFVQVSVTPQSVDIPAGLTQQFAAVVTGPADKRVTWTVTAGSIDENGKYTAPDAVPTPAAVTVTATSVADPTKSATATANIILVGVSITPVSVELTQGKAQQFTAAVTGTTNSGVTWTVNGIAGGDTANGTITTAGLYTAPASVTAERTVQVSASSEVDPRKTGTSSVKLVVVAVSVAPASVELAAAGTQQFTATVTGPTDKSVTWSVNGTPGGNATVGTISSTGLYTAPVQAPTSATSISIRATSVADPTKFGTATVTLRSLTISVSAGPGALLVGATHQFSATVNGASDTSITWSVNATAGGNATVGTISATGLYTAPSAVPNPATVSVTATSNADRTKSATVSLAIFAERLEIVTTALPLGKVNQSYQFALGAKGGVLPYSWRALSGLPSDGLSLQSNTIQGTPTLAGTRTVTFRVTDAAGTFVDTTLTLTIVAVDAQVSLQLRLPPTIASGQQQPIQIDVGSNYTERIKVELSLTFTPNAVNNADDPMVMFTNGLKQASFTIDANAAGTVVSLGSVLLQTGTVAGAITLNAKAETELSHQPVPLATSTFQVVVEQLPPNLLNDVRVIRKPYGFDVEVSGHSTTRELGQATFRFGARTGRFVQGLEFSVNLSQEATRWYQDAASTQFGSSFRYTQPFVIWGDISDIESVSVTVTNSRGASTTRNGAF